jgi:hypothetical protein
MKYLLIIYNQEHQMFMLAFVYTKKTTCDRTIILCNNNIALIALYIKHSIHIQIEIPNYKNLILVRIF